MFYNTINVFNMGEYVVSPILMLIPDRSVTFTATVVIAGISIVVGVLLLLILVFQIFGVVAPKIEAMATKRERNKAIKKAEKEEKKKAENKQESQSEEAVKPASSSPSSAPAPSPKPTPVVEPGISNEVVAAIAAAVVACEGPGAVVRTIKKKNVGGRNPWAQAANIDNTRPF